MYKLLSTLFLIGFCLCGFGNLAVFVLLSLYLRFRLAYGEVEGGYKWCVLPRASRFVFKHKFTLSRQ